MLSKVVEEEREVSQGAAILSRLKGMGLAINKGLEQSLQRIMVDNALSITPDETRTFGTVISNTTNNNWSDNK